MFPTLHLGPWHLSTYQVAGALGIIIGGMWALERLQRLGHRAGPARWGFVLAILGGIAAAQLTVRLINAFRVARSGLLVRPEGLSIVWGMLGAFAMSAVIARVQRVRLGRVLDAYAAPMFLGLAIARLGCFAAGCCYGRPTDSWLGLYLPSDQGKWAVRYPTQLMCAAANLLIAVVLVIVERVGTRRPPHGAGWRFHGSLFILGIALFSAKRFGMAFLRQAGTFRMIGPLSWIHVSALLGLGTTSALVAWNLYRRRRKGNCYDAQGNDTIRAEAEEA